MISDNLCVNVVYRDKDKQPVYTKNYTLREYTDMLRADLLRIITDIEDMCYAVNGGQQKEDWSDETFSGFNKIKHKILDKAGDIGRVPDNIRYAPESMTSFVARMIDGGDPDYGKSGLGPCAWNQGGGETDTVQGA